VPVPSARDQAPKGIARLAAGSPLAASKTNVEYFELPVRSVLNRCNSPRVPFRWTINPYRGCEFGCKYCYARYTHEFMGLDDSRQFEEKIYNKKDAFRLLDRELARGVEGAIAIGTCTDPYQPAERRFGTTRRILETLARRRGLLLSVTTKSDLITRDVDLLRRISRKNALSVNITVTTTDASLARKLEPFAPRPDLRFRAVRRLAEAGVTVGVFANPVMPLITDSLENLNAVAAGAASAGAAYFGGGTLFLMPSALQVFLPFLEKEFPRAAERYRRRYEKDPYVRGRYADWVRERVARVREKNGLAAAPPAPVRSARSSGAVQLKLLA